ncbi:MAG: amino acid racemase [Halofilum sp. (in: g-proteobacteria)]|nr:amino acid racemase [Halofilum sp. (in: g-proteobacteria)]
MSEAAPVVGVMGGMGPAATVEFQRRLLAATPAADDAGHAHVIVDNDPTVPSRIRALIDGDGTDPAPALAAMARRLEAAGADFLVMPCNTAHHYLPAIEAAVSVPVWDLVGITLARVAAEAGRNATVGLLASPALRRIGLYEQQAGRRGMRLLYVADEAPLLAVIHAVKADRAGPDERAALAGAAEELVATGAGGLVLACTEFSLLRDALGEIAVPVVDSLQALAEATAAAVAAGRVEPAAPA